MKWLIIGAVVVIAIFLFARCKSSNKRVQYVPKDNKKVEFSFKLQETDSVSQSVSIVTTSVKNKSDEPMYLQAHFKGQRIYAEKVLSIDLKLYPKNDASGLYGDEILIKNTYISCDFSRYFYNNYDGGELNFTGNLNSLILSNDDNTETRINNFYINKELNLKEYPKEIKAVITVKWIGGEQEFSTLLVMKEFKSSGKVRTNPFG